MIIGIVLCFAQHAVAKQPAWGELYEALTKVERDYYHSMFDYAMEAAVDGQAISWMVDDSGTSGQIIPGAAFITKYDLPCRPYEEYMRRPDAGEQRFEGVACKRDGKPGWCRLTKKSLPTCAFERNSGLVTLPNTGGAERKLQRWLPF